MGWTKRGVVRIAALTPAQEEQIPIFAEKWNRIARGTEPIDKKQAAAGIKQFYKDFDCKTPKCNFTKIDSVVGAWNASWYDYHIIEKANPNFWNLGRSEWAIRCFLARSFEPAVLKQVEEFMHRNVASSMSMNRAGRLEDAEDSRQQSERRRGYGQIDAPWLAIADYFATVHGDEACVKLRGLITAIAACGFVWLTPTKAVFIDRPRKVFFDDQGRLHNEQELAIQFGDWGWYFLHGISVSGKYVTTPADELKLEDVIQEKNSDVRSAVLHKIGFERLLTRTKHRVISQANGNELLEFKLHLGPSHNEYFRALRLRWQDKTGAKETLLPVPRQMRHFGADCPDNIRDCEQVRRWTLGWPKEALAVAET